MLKQPMQVYFDPEVVKFYKGYAHKAGKSFAAVAREAMREYKIKLQKEKPRQRKKSKEETESPYKALLKSIKKIQKKFGKGKYYYPKLTDDELLYGR